ncbi:tail protein X [Fusobacterium nucleatum]|uniref:tail protein X n=1 Tax=Fusobacterium nucleatum TaxID=851 RepID=UPI0030D00DD5
MKKVKVYKTVSGDTWDLISYKLYGSEQYFHQLMRANLNLLSIAVFDSNIPIIVPELDISTNTVDKSKLPPWKR